MMKILIVDDVAYLREELRELLDRVCPGNEYCEADNFDSAVKYLKDSHFDIAFLDIQIPGKNGLKIAEKAKQISPKTNIVMVTAFSEYAMEAFKLFVSGYLLKPVTDKDLIDVLDNLRNPVSNPDIQKLKATCFGNFEVFSEGIPFKFKRTKSKELLAYLIALKGASANRNEICANLYENMQTERANTNFRQAFASLKKDLSKQGFEKVLVHNSNNVYSVDTDMLECDYYDFITGKASEENRYRGEFMKQYSWAEQYIFSLENF